MGLRAFCFSRVGLEISGNDLSLNRASKTLGVFPKVTCVAPRAYPPGLGDAIHQVHAKELQAPALGDLRHREPLLEGKDDVALFGEMALGDTWPDAFLWPSFDYLYRCKYTRTSCGDKFECDLWMGSDQARRIPEERQHVMKAFANEWVSRRSSCRVRGLAETEEHGPAR